MDSFFGRQLLFLQLLEHQVFPSYAGRTMLSYWGEL